jgi:CysZ protein
MSQEPVKPIQQIYRKPLHLFAGATYPFRAFQFFVRHPSSRIYVLMPIAINIVLGITLYGALLFAGFRAIDAIIAGLPGWTTMAPQWSAYLPDWHFNLSWSLPLRNLLPDWHVNLPNWHVSLPNWHVSLPDWFTNLLHWSPTLPEWFTALPHDFAIALIWLLRLLLTIVLLFVTGFVLLQFGVLLGAPWYGKLSEELERIQTGQLTVIEVGAVQDIRRAILYELKKLVLGLGFGIPLLILGLFPGVGTLIGSVGGLLVTTTLVCLDFLDAPLERRRLRFRQKLGVIWRSLPASASFGLVCFGLVSIPLINLLAIPLCVAAGTLFVCDYALPELSASAPD